MAAVDHEASRNSSFVEIKSADLDCARGASIIMTLKFSGRNESSELISGLSAPARDSIPSTEIPFDIFSHISAIAGNSAAKDAALFFTSSLSASSRHG
ncbi:unannotated protein [freshwater metagenome]|uniref:Unannotated protein n=1 Tax=freshwater metagenome TaxID=449393 RepID=A0A6J6AXY6_9ZZZZ